MLRFLVLSIVMMAVACKSDSDSKSKDDGGKDAGTDAPGGEDGTDTADTDGAGAGDADAGDEVGEPTTETITFSGTVNLSNTVNAGDATLDSLTLGGPIEGATVFVAGFVEKKTATDQNGAFTIAIDVPLDSGLTADAFKVVTWFETSAAPSVKFGLMTSGAPTGKALNIGDVDLLYTRQARFKVTEKNTTTDVTDSADCAVQFLGFDDMVEAVYETGSGRLVADYLPAGTYDIKMTCTGYKPLTTSIDVTASTASTDWSPFDLEVEPN